jgi:hypothetical protein
MTKPSDPKRHPAQDTCGALLTISEDFHQMLRGSCPRCTTGAGPCGVEVIRQALAAEDTLPQAVEEPGEAAQLTWH